MSTETQKVPGFHDYHSNLMECIDWINDETARQKDFWERVLKPKVSKVEIPSPEVQQFRQDLAQLFADKARFEAQLAAAKAEHEKVMPVYGLLRLLIRQGAMLAALNEHYDGMFAFYVPT